MKIGDSISYINENKKGTIVSIKKEFAVILDEFGFEETVELKEIIVRDDLFYSKIPTIVKEETKISKSKKNSKAILTLDLHFHLLVKNTTSYSANERLQIQKEKLINTLEYCKKNPIKTLNIIHGIGDGVLQNMVFYVLEGFAGIEYEDQNLFHHSSGNVEVSFR